MALPDSLNDILYAEQEGKREASIAIDRQLFNFLDLETTAQKTGLTLEDLRSIQQDGIQMFEGIHMKKRSYLPQDTIAFLGSLLIINDHNRLFSARIVKIRNVG